MTTTPRITARIGISDVDSAFSQYAFSVNGVEMMQTSSVIDALRSMGLNPAESKVQAMIRGMDTNGTGFISKKAFSEFAESQRATSYSHKELEEMFYAYDENRTGYISTETFRNIFTGSSSSTMNEHELEHLLAIFDRAGKVSIRDYISLMCPELEVQEPAAPPVVEQKSHGEYIDKLFSDVQQLKARSVNARSEDEAKIQKWNEELARAEEQLKQAKEGVNSAMDDDEWKESDAGAAFSPLNNEGLRKLCEIKLLTAATDADGKVKKFYDDENTYKEGITKAREEPPAPMLYDESMEEIREALKKMFQLRCFMQARSSTVPPGLFKVSTSEKWAEYDQEEASRMELCEAYLSGLAGRDIGPKVRATAAVRSAHSLGVGKKFCGDVFTKAKTDLSFRSVEVDGRLFTAEESLFEGKTIFDYIPCSEESKKQQRSCSTFGGVNTLISPVETSPGSEVEGKKKCEDKGFTSFVCNNKTGQNSFYSENESAVARCMNFSGEGDSRVVFNQMLSAEAAAVQDAYEAGLMNEAQPKSDEFEQKVAFAYAIGDQERHDILSSCAPRKLGDLGEMYIAREHCNNISDLLSPNSVDSSGNPKLSAELFGELLKEMNITYGGMQVEMKDEYQHIVKDYELLQERIKNFQRWVEGKPEQDRKERANLEKEEEEARKKLFSEQETTYNTVAQERESSKPAPKPVRQPTPPPPPPAPKPKPVEVQKPPVKPKESKGCC